MNSDYLVILVTASSTEQARELAHDLLEKKLAACVNCVPIQSMYLWEGAIQTEDEVLMIIKSTSAVFQDQLVTAIKAKHSYRVPEIIALPIVLGSEDYLHWISTEVSPKL